jgi:hypothetical protein
VPDHVPTPPDAAAPAPTSVPPPPPPRRSVRDRRAPTAADETSERLERVMADVRKGRQRKQAARAPRRKPPGPPGASFAFAATEHDVPSGTMGDFLAALAAGEEEVSIDSLFGEMFDELVLLAASQPDEGDEPTTIRQALSGAEKAQWSDALMDEFKSLREKGTYVLVPRSSVPFGRRILMGKPVFKRKRDEHGVVVRYKARWVCKGFLQVFGQDFDKTTSPTSRLESLRILAHCRHARPRTSSVRCQDRFPEWHAP